MIPNESQFGSVASSPVSSTPVTAVGGPSMDRDSSRAASPVAAAKPAIDKSNWNKNVKVSQSQVDAVKDMGRGNMGAKAAYDMNVTRQRLGGLKSSPGAGDIAPRKANASEREAVKRIYPKAYAQATPGNTVPKSSRPFGGESLKPAPKPTTSPRKFR